MVINIQDVEKKVAEGKNITKEETVELLKQDDSPVEGYMNVGKKDEKESKEKDIPNPEQKPNDEKPGAEKPKEEKSSDQQKEDAFVRIERELQKPDGQEDLKSFSEREKAYFFQMRRDRRARQKAEEERDAALFREVQLKKEAPQKKEEKPKDEDPVDVLKKRDPTDFLTVQDVIAIVDKIKTPAAQPKQETPQGQVKDPMQTRFLKMCDEEARRNHPDDYDAVMELMPEIVNGNPEYVKETIKALSSGDNPAEIVYKLIKSDPEFGKLFPVAKTKVEARNQVKKSDEKKAQENPPEKTKEELQREKEAREAEEALERNNDKPKTTGHVGSGEERSDSDVTMEEISNMSDREFAKLPRKLRQEYLKKFG